MGTMPRADKGVGSHAIALPAARMSKVSVSSALPGMDDETQAAMLRRWAAECGDEADNPRNTPEQRERLLKMKAALLDLAITQDWLDGHPVSDDRRSSG
jgi:hypothetical protein